MWTPCCGSVGIHLHDHHLAATAESIVAGDEKPLTLTQRVSSFSRQLSGKSTASCTMSTMSEEVEVLEWGLCFDDFSMETTEFFGTAAKKEPERQEVRLLFALPDHKKQEVACRYNPLGAVFEGSLFLTVREVRKGTEAEALGIKPGWTLMEINGRKVPQCSAQECSRALGRSLWALPREGATRWLVSGKAETVALTGPMMPCEGLRGNFAAGAVLAPNGKVYCAPSGASQVLCIDPLRNMVEQLGPWLEGEAKYRAGGVLAPNGKIYFAPCCAETVMCVDTQTDHIKMIGPEMEGSHKYLARGVLAPNGKIYFAPARAAQVLCVDPQTDKVEFLGPWMKGDGWPDSGKYHAPGVLAGNGKVYFAPSAGRHVLCIDPATGSVGMLGQEMFGREKYIAAGVLAGDGRIYFAPADARQVLSIDPQAGTCELLGPELKSSRRPNVCGDLVHKYLGGAVAHDGRIFFAPAWASQVLVVDPAFRSVELCGPRLEAPTICAHYQAAGVVAPNGNIYFAPCGVRQVLRIDPGTNLAQMVGEELPDAGMRGKFSAAGVLASDGRIYFPPNFADRVLSIDTEDISTSSRSIKETWL